MTGVVADYRERELLVMFNKGREGEQWVKVDDHKVRRATEEGGWWWHGCTAAEARGRRRPKAVLLVVGWW